MAALGGSAASHNNFWQLFSVILDCVAAGMTAEEITAEYPAMTTAGVRAAAAYGTALAREELLPIPQAR